MSRAIRNCLLSVTLFFALPVGAQLPPTPTSDVDPWNGLANTGDIKAQVNLAYAYYTAKNYEEAAKWFFKAIDQSKTDLESAYAYYAIGNMALQGLGVKQDSVRAHVFLSLAVALGNEEAKKLLETVTKSLTPDQLVQAQTELLEAVTRNAQTEEKNGGCCASFRFAKQQRVYVVAVEANSRNLDIAKPDLLLERLAKDQFKRRRSFRIANALHDSDFVFLVVLDSAPGSPIEELAFAVSPAYYERGGVSLDALRNSALWQGENHVKVGRVVASLGWSEVFHRQNVVAGLVDQFHRDTVGK